MSGPKQTLVKSVNWQDPSKFHVAFTGPGAGILGLPADKITMAISNIQLPEMQSTPIEQYIAEEWRFAIGRLENFQITITMKDFDNFSLYKKWANAAQKFLRMYPDDQKFNVELETADDFEIDVMVPIVIFKDCMLISVSGPTLDNSSVASVAEFSVTLKSSYIKIL